MNSLNKMRGAYARRILINTRNLLVVLAPSIGSLRPGAWHAARLQSGAACAIPLTRRVHLIVGGAL